MTIDRRNALAALTVAGLIWGLGVPLTKLALGWLDPAWVATARFAIAAPVLAVVARRHLRGALSVDVAAWGAVGYGGVILLQNLGIAQTSVSHAALIVGAVPAMVALVTVATGRGAAGPLAWIGFLTALGGVALIAGSGGDSSLAGDGLVLAAGVLCALYIVAQTRLLDGRDAVAVTAVQMGASALATLPAALLAGAPVTGPATGTAIGAFAALATLGSIVPFALYAYGQARVPAEVAGAFVNLEPLVGTALGTLAFSEAFSGPQALGAAAILAGILLSIERPGDRPALLGLEGGN